MKRLWIVVVCCVASSLFAKDGAKVDWTPVGIQRWFEEYAKTEPDGARGIAYNGSDETHHRFSVRAGPGGDLIIRDVPKAGMKVPEEFPFRSVESGDRSYYYFLDPSRDFVQVPNPIAPSEARSLEERLAALEAYVNPTPSNEPASEVKPKLLQRARAELKLRLPGAREIWSDLRFEKPGSAMYVVIYTLPDRPTRWGQRIYFHYGSGKWHLFWEPSVDVPTEPAPQTGTG